MADGTVRLAEVRWYEAAGIGRKEFKIKRYLDRADMPAKKRFLLCIRNKGYEVSLERRKLYQIVPDADAGRHGQVRVVDESGEDYLYPATYFAAVELREPVRKAVLATSH